MKRYGNLWHQIISFDNILLAARKAQKGKRFRPSVLGFNNDLERELEILQTELSTKTYCPGNYTTFEIFDPKPPVISAAPYRDRVVHHALCNIIVPIIERIFIDDSYANRLGYGTHRALEQFTQFARCSKYILQCDISKYFPSIDRNILKQIIRRKIKCKDTLWLIDIIIDNSPQQASKIEYFPGDNLLTPLEHKRGLPIGNLTSQFFANVYLNGFDHFVKEELKARKYLRYVDDFSLFSDDRKFLLEAKLAIKEYLTTLRLQLHPTKSQLFETKYGANFVGFRVLPDCIRVRSDNLRRARIRLKRLKQEYSRGKIGVKDLKQRLQSWEAHLKHGDTYHLRQDVFEQYLFTDNKK